jgi:SpoVK/Ycf46/Vps4 family AAA+-type ATPase
MRKKKTNDKAILGDCEANTEEINQLFVGLNRVCDFSNGASLESRESSRKQFVESMQVLCSALGQLHDERKSDELGIQSNLPALEQAASRVRLVAHDFMAYLTRRVCKLDFPMKKILSSLRDKPAFTTLLILSRSWRTCLNHQVQQEKTVALKAVSLLDQLYSSSRLKHPTNDLLASLQNLVNILTRMDFIALPHARIGLQLLGSPNNIQRVHSSDLSLLAVDYDMSRSTEYNKVPAHCTVDVPITWQGIENFIESDAGNFPPLTSFLLVGPEGSGKTHICDVLEKSCARSSIAVLRPRLPLDILGQSVGEMEDVLVALVDSAKSGRQSCFALILDDADFLIATGESGIGEGGERFSGRHHIQSRSQSTFFALLDSFRSDAISCSRLILICTSKMDQDWTAGRFDRKYHILPPNEHERRLFICSNLGLHTPVKCSLTILLEDMVEGTVGRTYSEIALYCRQAAIDHASSETVAEAETLLHFLKRRLQSITPESLRSGVLDEFVDMRVWTARDLGSMETLDDSESSYHLPLFGSSAEQAWKDLQSTVIIPLCRARELEDLRNPCGFFSPQIFVGGMLLAGLPGTGKSSLAFHTAKIAARLLPTVKFLEVSCTSLIHKEVGGSERALHHLLVCARKAAPCILLMDSIETIAAVRGNDATTEGTMDRLLSTLLVELDGVQEHGQSSVSSPAGIAVIGITHNSDWIDPALLRPGRLDKIATLDLPDYQTRYGIAARDLKSGIAVPANLNLLNVIAAKTHGMSGASVAAVCSDLKLAFALGSNVCQSALAEIIRSRR